MTACQNLLRGNCSPGWRVVPWSGGRDAAVDEVTDGAEGRLAVQAGGPGDRAVADVDAGTQSERKPPVTLRNTTEGRISRSEMLLVAGTSRSVRNTKNSVRQP